MSDDEYDTTCPLCVEEMDLSDQNFLPCPCGYKVCMWCWHHIRENLNGLCPACRTPYNSDPHAFSAVDREDVVKLKKEKKQKEKQEKKVAERIVVVPGVKSSASTVMDRKHLHNYRVVQRNLVYVIGVPAAYASEEMLRKPEFFGQYGKIGKVVIHRNHSSAHSTVSVYVTFVHKEDAKASIQSLDGHWLDQNYLLRASFGTTKYCNNFIRGVPCNNPECVYLHDLGDDDDRFTKEEIQAGHSKIPPVPGKDQTLITGGGGPSGTGKRPSGEPVLPPPVFIQDNNPSPAMSAASSAAASMGATMAPPGVSVPRPAAVSRSGTATWGSSNTIAAILSEGPGSVADRSSGNSGTPVNLSTPTAAASSAAAGAALSGVAEEAPTPQQSVPAAPPGVSLPVSGIKRTASNASNAAPAEPAAPPTAAPAAANTAANTSTAAPAAGPTVPVAKSKAKTAKEIAAEKKAAAAANKAAAVAQAAEAAAAAAAIAGPDGEAKATAPVTKLSARQQMQQARAAAKAAHAAEKAERAANAAAAKESAAHDTHSNSSGVTTASATSTGEVPLPATSVPESPSVSAKKIIKRPESKNNLSSMAGDAGSSERYPSEDALPRLTPSISSSALSALGLMSEVPQVQAPPPLLRHVGFNGISTNAVFPSPMSSLSCSVWAYIMRASNEDLSINPYGQLLTPFGELLDLTLPPVDALHSCAPMWPRPMGYYLQGMQTDGITYTPAGKHNHQRNGDFTQPPLPPANPTFYRPSPAPRSESLLSALNETSTELPPKPVSPVPLLVPALVPIASVGARATPPPPALTPVAPVAPAAPAAAPVPVAAVPTPHPASNSAFQKPVKGHKERNNHNNNHSSASHNASSASSATASPAPPNLTPVSAPAAAAAPAPTASGGSSAGISALRQLFPGVKMSVSGSNK